MFKNSPPQQARSSVPPPSIDDVRRRAKHRLMGATVLVVAGVVVFPWLFDSQPRPIPVDIPVSIPSRNTSTPLRVNPPVESTTSTPAKPVEKEEVVSNAAKQAVTEKAPASSSPNPQPSITPSPIPTPTPVKPATPAVDARKEPPPPKPAPPPVPEKPKVVEKAAEKPVEKVVDKPVEKPVAAKPPAVDDGMRALALLNDQQMPHSTASTNSSDKKGAPSASNPSDKGRFVVQVGAFADADKAQQVRQKLERAGLKTYTHVAETADGPRIRVRLGPFSTRGDADQAAAKAKAQGLTAAILSL